MLGGFCPHMGRRRGGRRRTDAISVYPGVRREAEGYISLPPHTRPSEPGERMLGRGFPRQNLASPGPFPTLCLNTSKDKNLDSACFTFGALKS